MTTLKRTYPLTAGAEVLRLQERLAAHGADPGAQDGLFGAKTEAAVRAFQLAHGLAADGVAGPLTWAALEKAPAGEQPAEGAAPAEGMPDRQTSAPGVPAAGGPAGLLEEFLAFLQAQVGHIYVWGGQGQSVKDESWIYRHETSTYNAMRAVGLFRKRQAEGRDPILAYDCSGLIMAFLQNMRQVFSYDMSAASLYKKCSVLSRSELRPGDLVFRHNGARIYHVGVYMGDGAVIEAKGRDDGVVRRGLNASGTAYWNRFGRLTRLSEG